MAETSDPDDEPESSDGSDQTESVATMSAAVSTTGVTNLAAVRELRERKTFYRAMREGERVSSEELRDANGWMRAEALHDVLAQTRRLSSAHLHYLLAVIARGHRSCGYVTADYNDATPPSLADWSRWLRGVGKQNVYRMREELHSWRIITYVDHDPMRVAINPIWETWDASVFEAREAKPGGGRRPASRPATSATGARNLARLRQADNDADNDTAASETGVISQDDSALSSKITGRNLPRLLSSSSKITGHTPESAADADSQAALLTLNTSTLSTRDTLACIPAAAPATPSPLAPDPLAPPAPSEVIVPTDTPDASFPPTAAQAPTASNADKPAKTIKAEKPPRALSPDHQYRVDLLAAIEQANGGLKPPARNREWAAAGKFFARPAGAAPIEQVTACYALERQRPRWDSDYLSLTALLSHYDAYVRSPTNYARAIERARAAAEGAYDQPRESNTPRDSRDSRDSRGGLNHDSNTTPAAATSRRVAVTRGRGGGGASAGSGNPFPVGTEQYYDWGERQQAERQRALSAQRPGGHGAE